MITINDDWEFNVLGIYNFRKPGPLDSLFNFVRDNCNKIEGDILESGVYRGKTLLAMGLMLKELGSKKLVYGFDSFSGFPVGSYHRNDDLQRFDDLYSSGKISHEHLMAVQRNRIWRNELIDRQINSSNISSSGNFSETSLDLVKKKISMLGLDNIVLIDDDFKNSMTSERSKPGKIMAALMDCDLYESYLQTFNFVWPRLSEGGMIYLDEYYSLKFPGARIATDEFLATKNCHLQCAPKLIGDFERWYVVKGISK